MSTFIEKTQETPAATKTEYTNSATNSSARKYTTTNTIPEKNPQQSISNSEHIIKSAFGIKSLALAVEKFAEIARKKIDVAQQALLSTTSDPNPNARSTNGQYTDSDVKTVQDDAALQVANSFEAVADPNLRQMLVQHAQQSIVNSRYQVMPIREETVQVINRVVPELESITVDLDKDASVVDNFSATVLFNLPATSTGTTKAIRIFRAVMDKPVYTRPLSTLSSIGIERLTAYRGRKNQDNSSAAQIRFDEHGVPNAISNLNSINEFTGNRASSAGKSTLLVPPPFAGQGNNTNDGDNTPTGIKNLDASVSNDISVYSHLLNDPLSGYQMQRPQQPISVGSNINMSLQLGQAQSEQVRSFTSNSTVVVENGNQINFVELAFLTTDKLAGIRVGDRVEYRFRDTSVSYGKGYKYFVCTVDENMIQSQRSMIATVVVEGMRIPERPKTARAHIEQSLIALSMTVDDTLIEKFEVYRMESDINRTKEFVATTLSDADGFSVRKYIRTIASNNYLLIGECANPMKGGTKFTDVFVKPGHFYTYRIYSVDIFGNKSESPAQIEAYIPDLEQQFIYMQTPSIMTECDAESKSMRITFACDDKNVEKLQLERRDLTIGQSAFTTPTTPPRTILGQGSIIRGRRFVGEVMTNYSQQGDDYHWNGVFFNNTGSQQVFKDPAVQFDHIYQYRIYGEDRYGNRSPYAVSGPLMLSRRPFINAPLGLAPATLYDDAGSISGISLSWTEANLDKSAEELIGNQVNLSSTFIRSMYSVQRKKEGENQWKNFSLMTGTTLFDPVVDASGTAAPNYRPPYLDLNHTYQYRVQAVQTGAFISNFTEPVSVFVGFSVQSPSNFTIRYPQTYVRPFYVMLNWDTPTTSGIVDRWEIQRVAVNNLAASRLNMKNPTDFANLKYASFRTVYRESSRFSSKVVVNTFSDLTTLNAAIMPGQHCFMDTQVDFGNSYFYRIRAVSMTGEFSAWTYKGVKITSSVFEQKWIPLLTAAEAQALVADFSPMMFSKGMKTSPKSSFSMLSDYAKPDSIRASPRTSTTWSE